MSILKIFKFVIFILKLVHALTCARAHTRTYMYVCVLCNYVCMYVLRAFSPRVLKILAFSI